MSYKCYRECEKRMKEEILAETEGRSRNRKRSVKLKWYEDTGPKNAVKEKKKKQKQLLREKIKKTLLEIEKLGGLFRITDVLGDGNCLYNALVKSPDIRFSCPLEFREHLFEAIEERSDLAEHLYYEVAKETDEFDAWIQKMRKPGTWGGATVALFVC